MLEGEEKRENMIDQTSQEYHGALRTYLETSGDRRIRRWLELNQELQLLLQGKTPLGLLAWLRWMAFILPIRAAISGASWWQSLLLALAIFAAVSVIDPAIRRFQIGHLRTAIPKLEAKLNADGILRTEIDRFNSTVWADLQKKSNSQRG